MRPFEKELLELKNNKEKYNEMLSKLATATKGEKVYILNKLEMLKRLEAKQENIELAASIRDLSKTLNSIKSELNLVADFHNKFNVPIAQKPTLIKKDRAQNRYKLIKDEVEEYKQGTEKKDIENIAKELADILYATYGAILEHGLQNIITEVFAEVHKSNMSKEYNQYKMIKGEKYFEADIKQLFNE